LKGYDVKKIKVDKTLGIKLTSEELDNFNKTCWEWRAVNGGYVRDFLIFLTNSYTNRADKWRKVRGAKLNAGFTYVGLNEQGNPLLFTAEKRTQFDDSGNATQISYCCNLKGERVDVEYYMALPLSPREGV
jgi:hypothetical protein